MARTGSDPDSAILIWKHNTMGHMDNGVEEAISMLIKKQQEGFVNSQSQVSFASESYAAEKPKKGFLKRFLGLGKKDSSDGHADVSSTLIQDKSSSFETIRSGRSRGSSHEELRATSDFRVFRDGKGAAVVARSDGRNFKDLARKAREAGFPDLARQLETAQARRARTFNGSIHSKASSGKHQNSTQNQATAAEIIDRVRARNAERLGRSASGKSSEAERYGEIPIRSAADLLAHRAELAQESRRMSSLKQAQAAVLSQTKKTKAPEERSSKNDCADASDMLERTAMIANWLHFGNITGNPILYEDTPEASGMPAQLSKLGSEAPIPDVLEIEDRVLFNQKQAEDGLLHTRGDFLNGYAQSKAPRQPDQRPALKDEEASPDEGALRVKSTSKSPLAKFASSQTKAPDQRAAGGACEKAVNAEKLVKVWTVAEPADLRQEHSASALERSPVTGKNRWRDAIRPAVKGIPSAGGLTPVSWVGEGKELLHPLSSKSPGSSSALVSPRGAGLELGKSARWPADKPFQIPQVASKTTSLRQATGRSNEEGLEEDGEHYNPAQWHKYLELRSAQVLPNLSVREEAPPVPKELQSPALPLPLPPDLHPLPLSFSLGPTKWSHKMVDSSDYNVSGGATPRSPASSISEPRSPSSPLRRLLLSPQTGHMVGPWPVLPA